MPSARVSFECGWFSFWNASDLVVNSAMPTVWVDQSIQVLDDILIDPPSYEPSACHFRPTAVNPTSAGQQTKLDRVHKVLAGERAKLLAAGVAVGNGAAT